MAIIRAFRALRPIVEKADLVASVPYDVVNTEEAKELAKGNPYSFLHVIRPEIDLPDGIDPYDERVYKKARENMEKLIKQKILVEEAEPSLYIYRLSTDGHSQTGVVGCLSVDEYDRGIIKKHELTRKVKEDDRVRHMLATSAHTGPVLITFREDVGLKTIIKENTATKPLYDFTAPDGVRHTVWRVEDWSEIKKAFRRIPSLYIADGHHRAAGASRVQKEMIKKLTGEGRDISGDEEFNYFLAVVFPSDELRIQPYNRYVKDLGKMDEEAFLSSLGNTVKVEETDSKIPSRKGIICMYLGKKWYKLDLPESGYVSDDPVGSLDISVFQRLILEPILGIIDQKKDPRIDFVGGDGSVEKIEMLVDTKGGVGFSFYPVNIEELIAVADAGKIMPPKSTWFSPKLRSGLLIHGF